MDVRSRHRTNPRSTRFVLGKASEYRRRPRSCHVDRLSDRREVAQGVLCFSPNLSKLFFFASEQLGEKRDRYFLPSVFYTPADDTPLISIKNKATGQRASVSGKARDIDGNFRNFMWIHGLGGQRLLVMSYALHPKPKNAFFCHRRWIEIFCHLFPVHQRSDVFSDAWQAPAIYHRPSCELCDPRVGRSP